LFYSFLNKTPACSHHVFILFLPRIKQKRGGNRQEFYLGRNKTKTWWEQAGVLFRKESNKNVVGTGISFIWEGIK
jgi:hypothetical protein